MQKPYPSESPSEQEIRAELERILQSSLFLQSDRLGRFLRFAIENALAGDTDLLKEYVIGTEVYDRKPPYHPSQDSIVRTEARRLRAKLREYYEIEGKQNPVFIYFRTGTYVPLFRRNDAAQAAPPKEISSNGDLGDLWVKGAGVALAILPFVDLSNRPLSAMCAQGLTDELIHNFTRTDGIRVIARPSHPQLVESPYDIPSLSQRFGLTNIVEGTVREDGSRLLVTIKVLGSDGFQLSSHRFETIADAEALAQVQEQMATAFISRVRSEHSLVRRRKAAPGSLTFAAYALIMHAETLLDEGSSSDIPAALLKFQEAREIAPSYARVYTGISHCHLETALRGAGSSSALVAAAKEAALRAVSLDPEMIEPYSCLGAAQALAWDWESAEKSFLHGMSLGTRASSSRRYGFFLTAQGRNDEGAHYLDMAARIDPFSNRQKVARIKFLHLTRRFDEGMRLLSARPVHGPLPVEARLLLALICTHAGDIDRARQLVGDVRSAVCGQVAMMAGIAEVLALSGETDEANRIAREVKALSKDAPVSRSRQALLCLALGDVERTLSLLKQAFEIREAELVWLGIDPRFDAIRERPAFQEIVSAVLPAASE